MSLTGIRDLSTIFSPPEGRQNVTTYIMKATDDILKRAITREMSRGGQVGVCVCACVRVCICMVDTFSRVWIN